MKAKDDDMTLSQALTAKVEAEGISWRAAGDMIGVPYQTLSNWATGKYRPSREDDLLAIANFLGTSVKKVKEMRARDKPEDRLSAIEARLTRIEGLLGKLTPRESR